MKKKPKTLELDGFYRHPFRKGWRVRAKHYMSWLHHNLATQQIPLPNPYRHLPKTLQGGSIELHHTPHPHGKPRDDDSGVFPLTSALHMYLEQNPAVEEMIPQKLWSSFVYWVFKTVTLDGEVELDQLLEEYAIDFHAWVVEKLHESDLNITKT